MTRRWRRSPRAHWIGNAEGSESASARKRRKALAVANGNTPRCRNGDEHRQLRERRSLTCLLVAKPGAVR